MKTWMALFFAISAYGQGITSRTISPFSITRIVLSQNAVTVLKFPQQFSGVYGLGLVLGTKDNKAHGTVQGAIANKDNLILHALSDTGTQMTVDMGDTLYVFDLTVGDDPDVAVTLTSSQSKESRETTKVVTPPEVAAARPKYDDTILQGLMDKTKGVEWLKTAVPEIYRGYRSRKCSYISDDGTVKTEVTIIHQFPSEDAILLEGTIQNNSDKPLVYDSDHVGIAIDSQLHPVTFMEHPKPVPPHGVENTVLEIIGDYDGSRASYSMDNEFRIIINTGYHVSFSAPIPSPTPTPTPKPTPNIPKP